MKHRFGPVNNQRFCRDELQYILFGEGGSSATAPLSAPTASLY